MATIDELMEGKKPGEIKVTCEDYLSCSSNDGTWHFVPYYKSGDQWYGLIQNGDSREVCDSDTDWQLYTKPKKKVKRWLWAGWHPQYEWITPNEFRSDEEMEKQKKTTVMTKFRKLPWSEMEFDE